MTHAAKNLTHDPGNDAQPMWHGDTLYFLSDRDANKRGNIWALDTASGAFRQVTRFEEYDVRFPSIGPSDIVFENADRLYRLELPGEALQEVKVEVVTDRATLRPRAEKVAKLIANPGISPTGKRALLEARGGVFSLPEKHGVVLELTARLGRGQPLPGVVSGRKERRLLERPLGRVRALRAPGGRHGQRAQAHEPRSGLPLPHLLVPRLEAGRLRRQPHADPALRRRERACEC